MSTAAKASLPAADSGRIPVERPVPAIGTRVLVIQPILVDGASETVVAPATIDRVLTLSNGETMLRLACLCGASFGLLAADVVEDGRGELWGAEAWSQWERGERRLVEEVTS